jgi:hypothetical protein
MPFSLKRWISRLSAPTPSIRASGPGVRPRLEPLEERWLPTAYTVNTTIDQLHETSNGLVTLRDVLNAIHTNASSGNAAKPSATNTISFAIGTTGSVQTINLTSPLPSIPLLTTIDGLTQGGTNYSGDPLIVLNGAGAGAGAVGLQFNPGSDGSTVDGLVLESFKGNGIVITGASDILVTDNNIGTNAMGTAKLGNGDGVLIEGGATANTIGGSIPNLISGNTTGVEINGIGTSGNLVFGNFVGTDVNGTATKLGNSGDGILIDGGASDNSIGSVNTANLLSANLTNGVEIRDPGTSANVVMGNFIGTGLDGTTKLGNHGDGVLIDGGATGNSIGTASAPNVISGNLTNGIEIKDPGTSANVVLDNFIGTNLAGAGALPNIGDGVLLDGGATANTIGNPAGNVISGNAQNGVEIQGAGTSANVVFDNFIGTQPSGSAGLGNKLDGVLIDQGATANSIGSASGGNLISANVRNGVEIKDGGTSANVVLKNFIGTDVNGTAALGNTLAGLLIDSNAKANTIGGTAATDGNILSANKTVGLLIEGSGVSGNVVLGNFVGTNRTGTAALGNAGDGILITGGASANTIGATANTMGGTPGRNVISGNSANGIEIQGTNGTSGNVVLGNYVGIDKTGTARLANGGDGILIDRSATANTIGSTAAGTILSGNAKSGIEIQGAGTSGNIVLGTFIGTDKGGAASLGNTRYGVLLDSGATANTIGGTATGYGNIIAFDAEGVVLAGSTTLGNPILGNSIFGNKGPGIDLGNSGANRGLAGPVLTGASGTTVAGTLTDPAGTYIVEVFAYPAAETTPDGKQFLGSSSPLIISDSKTPQPFTVTVSSLPSGMLLSATATNVTTGDTSVFTVFTTVYAVNTVRDLLGDKGKLASGAPEVTLRDVLTAIATGAPSGNAGKPGPLNVVFFTIGTSRSVQTINLSSSLGTLPAITVPTIINAFSQGGKNYTGAPLIALNGSKAGTNIIGLDFNRGSDGSAVLGLVIQDFGDDGIVLNGTSGNLIAGDYIGTDVHGTAKLANGTGILISNGAAVNTVGGAFANLISGNTTAGVTITNSSGNLVLGNLIGAQKNGTTKLGNGDGVALEGGATANTVGGTSASAANVISGNLQAGLLLSDSGTSGNVVLGNDIGTDSGRTINLGNTDDGVLIANGASANTIGGTTKGARNVIAFNAEGVVLSGSTTVGDSISENSIFQNTGAGIDLGGPAGNDAQIAPVLTSASATSVSGTLTGPTGTFSVELFAYPYTDTALEGKTFLTSAKVTIVNSGDTQSFTVTGLTVPRGMLISATATNTATGDTSAFARLATPYTVNTATDILGDTGHLPNGSPEVTLRDVLTALGGAASGNAQPPSTAAAIILFSIGKSGSAQVINLTSALPSISFPTIINGLSQGGSSYTGAPLIVLNGAGVLTGASSANGLTFSRGSNNSVVEGLAIEHFGGDGIVLNATSGILIAGNYIGTDVHASAKAGNTVGILIEGGATANTIGDTLANLLAGNQTGVEIKDSGTSGNIVRGDFIGTNARATAANLGNSGDGVLILGGATANTIGSANSANIISGNGTNGVEIQGSGTSGNVLLGNFIGTGLNGASKLGNHNDGVLINQGATANTIGASPGKNVLSGNSVNGVEMRDTGTSANVVLGNYIGTNLAGNAGLANAHDGILVDNAATANTIGGSAGNIISGNAVNGVEIKDAGTSANVLLKNNIGTDSTGSAALANVHDGVLLDAGTTANTIGGTAAGDGNILSGNGVSGIEIKDAGTSGNLFLQNDIGTDSTGKAVLGNAAAGVHIDNGATANTIGGTAAGIGNVISGNTTDGVLIENGGTSGNLILGNFIGIASDGTASLGNAKDGIHITGGATANTIGGTASGAGNVVSGNLNGVEFAGKGTSGNVGLGNLIGTDKKGTVALGNSNDGVLIDSGASANTIGGLTSENVLSGNAKNGVEIKDTGTSGNVLLGNLIGTDKTDKAKLGNSSDGVLIDNGATANTIGGIGTGAGNVLAGNTNGLQMSGSKTSSNVLLGNFIGIDKGDTTNLGNSKDGILFDTGVSHNTVGGTVAGSSNEIAFNKEGVVLSGTTTIGDSIRQNSIHGNTTLGIDLGKPAANDGLKPPVLTFPDATTITATLTGKAGTYVIEVYLTPTGGSASEGQTYLGLVTITIASGQISESGSLTGVTVPSGMTPTATATNEVTGDTSAFSL